MKNQWQTVLDIHKIIADPPLEIVLRIQETLKLTFVHEKVENGNVCMAYSPEVRDEYRDVFDTEDLLNYMYAVLHAPNYRRKFKDLSKKDFFQVNIPDNHECFWKCVGLGAQLRKLHWLVSPTGEKFDPDIDTVLKKIAEIEMEKSP